MLALKRLSDAERDGDRVYAVIARHRHRPRTAAARASTRRSPRARRSHPAGRTRSRATAPTPSSWSRRTAPAPRRATPPSSRVSGWPSATAGRADRQWCALGSVKSQIGHTKAAAGAAGLFKAVMALHHRRAAADDQGGPAQPQARGREEPLLPQHPGAPVDPRRAHPRRASVSSFGFGGSNFHIAMEEYTGPGRAARGASEPPDRARGAGRRERDGARRPSAPGGREARRGTPWLAAVARTSQEAFRASDRCRLAVVASDAADLAAKLAQAQLPSSRRSPRRRSRRRRASIYGAGEGAGPVAFLFPGQGSQYVGMGADVAMSLDAARAVWDEAAATRFDGRGVTTRSSRGRSSRDAERDAQARQLTATEWAQPAIGLTSLALLGVVRAAGVAPVAWAAQLRRDHRPGRGRRHRSREPRRRRRRRGELMRDASQTPGAMTAGARPIEEVRAILAELGDRVVVANHNHPTQVVLSGAEEEIARAEQHLAGNGVTAKRRRWRRRSTAPAGGAVERALRGVPGRDHHRRADGGGVVQRRGGALPRRRRDRSAGARRADRCRCGSWRRSRACGRGARACSWRSGRAACSPRWWVASSAIGRTWRSRWIARASTVTSLQEGLGRLAIAASPSTSRRSEGLRGAEHHAEEEACDDHPDQRLQPRQALPAAERRGRSARGRTRRVRRRRS